jgi:hypothetical protein
MLVDILELDILLATYVIFQMIAIKTLRLLLDLQCLFVNTMQYFLHG